MFKLLTANASNQLKFSFPILLIAFVIFLSSCSKKIEIIEQISPPVANFSFAIKPIGNNVELTLKSHSTNTQNWKWIIDNNLIRFGETVTIELPKAPKFQVRLEVTNPAGKSISEKTIFYTEPAKKPTIKNVSYSWWCDPISIYYEKNNYFSGVDSIGQQVIICYNSDHNRLVSKNINSGYRRDEHNSPAFIVRPNGILTAYTGHDEDRKINIKLLSHSLDNEGPEKTVLFPSSTSYTQLFEANGRIFLTTRCITKWFVSWSDDGGENWSNPLPFFEKLSTTIPGAFYIRPLVVAPDKIKIGAYMHPTTARDKLVLYYCEFNPQTGDIVTEKNKILGNLYADKKNGVDMEQLDTIYAATTGNTFRFLDIAQMHNNQTAFLIATTKTNDYNAGDYVLAERDHLNQTSKFTKIVAHGNDLPHDTYWGGAYFVVDAQRKWNSEIYLAREEANTWYIEKYKSSNNMVLLHHEIERYLSKDRRTLSRPLPPIGATEGGISVIYQKGEYYGYPSYMNWRNMELVLVQTENMPTNSSVNAEQPNELIENMDSINTNINL